MLSVAPISAVGPRFDRLMFALSDTLPPTIAAVFFSVFECVVSVPPAIIAPLLTISPALTLRLLTDSSMAPLVNVPGRVKARLFPALNWTSGVAAKSP